MGKSNLLSILKKLIKIDSRNPFLIQKRNGEYFLGGNEDKINAVLTQLLEGSGFKVKKQFVHEDIKGKKHYNLIAEKGEGNSSILFYGHSDTVSSQPWLNSKDAFTPRIGEVFFQGKKRKAIFGLGSNDMKTGLAVICTAFKDIKSEGYKIKVGFGVDEEFYSLGANVMAKSEFMKDVKAIVVPEIGDGPNKFYGHETIGIGRLGRCEFEIEVFGTGGHGAISNDKTFINAAEETSKFVVEFEKFRKKHKDIFVFSQEIVPDKSVKNRIEGSFFISKIDCGNESLSIPANGRIVIDCTFTPNMTINKLRELFENFINDLYEKKVLKPVMIEGINKKFALKLKERPTPYSESYLTPADDGFTKFVRECIDKIGNFKNYNMGYSVADENVFRRFNPKIPIVVLGPIGWNSHRADEWAEIESIEKLYDLYTVLGSEFGNYCRSNL